MTASNRIDILVKNDGSVEPLLPTETKVKRPKRYGWKVVALAIGLFLVVAAAFLLAFLLSRPKQEGYKMYYPYGRVMRCGTMDFQTQDATEIFATEDVITVTDGLMGTSAIKINITTDSSNPAFICMIRNDEEYGMAGPPILPAAETLNTLMKETVSEGPFDVVMGEDYWMPDEYEAVNFDHLPTSMQELCSNVPIFKMRPMSNVELEETYEIHKETDDEEGTNQDESDKDQYKDDHDDYFINESELGNLLDIDNESVVEEEVDEEEDEYYDDDDSDDFDPASTLSTPGYVFDYYKPNPDYFAEDDVFSQTLPSEDVTTPDPITRSAYFGNPYRKKRQAPSKESKFVQEGNNNEPDNASPSSEAKSGLRDNNSPSLNLGEGQTDVDLQCCHHCTRGYLQCNRVCVPVEQQTYPYFHRSCNFVQCNVVLPCLWWRARAAGYV